MDAADDFDRFDAIVVGAGPAGSTCAALLARGGRRTLLLDAGDFPRHKVCGECLGESARPVLRSLEIERQVLDNSTAIDEFQIVVPRGLRLTLPLVSTEQRLIGISRYELDRLLLERAQQWGVRLLTGWRVSDVAREEGRVCGVVVSPSGGGASRTLNAPLVVAADGRRSIVVRHTGVVRRRGPAVVGVKRHFRLPDRPPIAPGRLEMHSYAGGYLGLCIVAGNVVNVCGVVPRGVLKATRGSIDATLQRLLPTNSSALRIVTVAEPLSPWLSVPDVQRQWSLPQTAGVLYVGDALGTIEPLTGQGMSMALLTGQWAAERILHHEGAIVDAAFQQRFAREFQRTFGSIIRWGASLGCLLRHPRVLTTAVVASRGVAAWQSRAARAAFNATRVAGRTAAER